MAEQESADEPAREPYLVGYARVSTEDQNLDLQVRALIKAGVQRRDIHTEKVSGAAKNRRALDECIKTLRPGDTLVVWRLDRLARSMRDLYARLDDIHDQGASFRSITEQFDFSSVTGQFVLGILGLVAQLERQLTIARTTAGIEAWKARGGVPGRRVKMTPEVTREAMKLLRGGMEPEDVAKQLGVGKSSLYTHLWIKGRKVRRKERTKA